METSPAGAPFRNQSLNYLNETQSRSHLGLSLQLSNINSIEVLANVVFGISAAERHIPLRGAVRPDDDTAQPLTPTRTQPPPSSQQPMLDPESLSHEPSLADGVEICLLDTTPLEE